MSTGLSLLNWELENLDSYMISDNIPSMLETITGIARKRLSHTLAQARYGDITIIVNGFEWRLPAFLATQTSKNLNAWVHESLETYQPTEFHFDKQHWAHPVVVDLLYIFWCALEVDVSEPNSLRKISSIPENAAKFAVPITVLKALVFLHDAAVHLNDAVLKDSVMQMLRLRLLKGEFTDAELTEALAEVFRQGRKVGANQALKAAFLTAAILHNERLTTGAYHGQLSLALLSSEFRGKDIVGTTWYMRHYRGRAIDSKTAVIGPKVSPEEATTTQGVDIDMGG